MKSVTVGVAGGTGSGKTTLAKKIVESLGKDAVILSHDNYYFPHPEMPFEQRCRINYDHPDSLDTNMLVGHIKALQNGQSVEQPLYDFATHMRKPCCTTVQSAPVIVVEGILIFQNTQLRDMFDLKIFVESEVDVRFVRRLLRDINERGRTMQSVVEQYFETVKPMHNRFVQPTKVFADMVTENVADPKTLDEILKKIAQIRSNTL